MERFPKVEVCAAAWRPKGLVDGGAGWLAKLPPKAGTGWLANPAGWLG